MHARIHTYFNSSLHASHARIDCPQILGHLLFNQGETSG